LFECLRTEPADGSQIHAETLSNESHADGPAVERADHGPRGFRRSRDHLRDSFHTDNES